MTTPFVYIVFKLRMDNKQYLISFKIATSSQTKLKLKNFPHAFFLVFKFLNIQVNGSLNN